MEDSRITIETTVAYPGKWRMKDDERMITFTIPCHSELFPFLKKPTKSIQCYYRNLRFKYSTLTRGTSIRLTASIDIGARGGLQLHIHDLEIIGNPVPNLSKVTSQMMKKWTKQIEKTLPERLETLNQQDTRQSDNVQLPISFQTR